MFRLPSCPLKDLASRLRIRRKGISGCSRGLDPWAKLSRTALVLETPVPCALVPSAGQGLSCCDECVRGGREQNEPECQSALYPKTPLIPRSLPCFITFFNQRSRNGRDSKAERNKTLREDIKNEKNEKNPVLMSKARCRALSYPFSSFNPIWAGGTAA